MFKKNKAPKEKQLPLTTAPDWQRAAKKTELDRISLYFYHQQAVPPRQYFNSMKKKWLIATVLNLLSLSLIAMSIIIPIQKNLSNDVKLVRVDGLLIEEARDQRRDVLVENVLMRTKIKKENNQQ